MDDPKKAISYIGLAGFFGCAVSCLFVPRLGDLYGRWRVWSHFQFFQCFIMTAVSVTTYPAVLVGFTFLSGFGIVGRMSAGFLLLMET
jgi:MFS family permease